MALKRFTTAEMVSHGKDLLDAKAKVFAGIPEAASLVARLEEAQAGLIASQPKASERSAALREESRKIDAEHDDVCRGLFYVLTGTAFLSPPSKRAELEALVELLFPTGLSVVGRSAREEAGESELRAARVTEAARASLGALSAAGKSLLAHLTRLEKLAARLGEIDGLLVAADGEGVAPSAHVQARNQWIRVVSALRTVLELVGQDALLSEIASAEAKADRRPTGEQDGEPKDDGDDGDGGFRLPKPGEPGTEPGGPFGPPLES